MLPEPTRLFPGYICECPARCDAPLVMYEGWAMSNMRSQIMISLGESFSRFVDKVSDLFSGTGIPDELIIDNLASYSDQIKCIPFALEGNDTTFVSLTESDKVIHDEYLSGVCELLDDTYSILMYIKEWVDSNKKPSFTRPYYECPVCGSKWWMFGKENHEENCWVLLLK
jgi:hypothetical protein